MNITKCDLCKKVIKKGGVRIRLNEGFYAFELCSKCMGPVIDFLKDKKLVTDDMKGAQKGF